MADVHFLISLPAGLEWFLALLVSIAALWVIGKKVVKWWTILKHRLTTLYDSIAGFEQLIDPVSGEVVRSAVPGINARVLTIEHWQAEMLPLMTRMTEAMERLAAIDTRLTAHELFSHQWIADHDSHYGPKTAEDLKSIEAKLDKHMAEMNKHVMNIERNEGI